MLERGDHRPGLRRGISEKVFVEINGAEQGMFIRGRDASNPVLLWLHGGIPDTFLIDRYPTGLEELFTVVWWEQRGSGISVRPGTPLLPPTCEQLIEDMLAVTEYLRERFTQERIYVLAHSGGSFFGIQGVARAPDRYAAYLGVAQMADQLRSEVRAYDYMLGRFAAMNDRAMLGRLERAPVSISGGVPREYLALRDAAMHRLGIGTMHEMRSIVTGLLLPSLAFRGYSTREKVNLWRAKMRSGVSALWGAMLTTDLSDRVPRIDVPVYFLHGIYDYTCSYAEARSYFTRIEAPVKGFYTFEHSAHSPMFEEPERTRRILQHDVLAGAATLADRLMAAPAA